MSSRAGDLRAFVSQKDYTLALVDVVVNNLASVCMATQGFNMPRREPPAPARAIPYGLPEDADPELGFHMPRPDTGALDDQPTQDGEPAFEAALTGGQLEAVPVELQSGDVIELYRVGGCIEAARVQAFGGQDAYLDGISTLLRLQDLSFLAERQAVASPEQATLDRDWAACVGELGFTFANPLDAWAATWPNPVGADERLAAATDVGCKRQVDYTARADSIRREYDGQVLESNAGLLEQWTSFEQQVAIAVAGR